MFIILSFIKLKQPHLADLCSLRTRINMINFVRRIVQGTHLRGNYVGKIPNLVSFGAVNPHPSADQGEIWQG